MARYIIILLIVTFGLFFGAQQSSALSDVPTTSRALGNCRVELKVNAGITEAYVSLANSYLAGDNYFYNGSVVAWSGAAISASDIALCLNISQSNIITLSQNGADGTFASDPYIGFAFELDIPVPTFGLSAGWHEFFIGTGTLVPSPTVTSATFDAATGTLVVTGTNMISLTGANNDIAVSKLTLTGEGGATYTLTSSDVEITSNTSFSVTLNASDKTAVNMMLNKNGTSSTGATTYNLAAAEDWAQGADAAVVTADLTGNGITVSNVGVPTITSATYDASTGTLVVTGTSMSRMSGATNDINVSKLTLTGEGGATRTLTSTSVEITSATSFSVTLNAGDKTAVNMILNKNGTSSRGATTYNLAAAEDWAQGADAAVVTSDLTGNGITVSNADTTAPTVSNVSFAHAPATKKINDNVFIDVFFSEAVTVAGSGTPQLTLETGATDRVIDQVGSIAANNLRFRYTVQAGDTASDLDYISTAALALNSVTIKDASGNDAVLTLPVPGTSGSLSASSTYVIDGIVPTVNSVSVPAAATYHPGDNLDFTVNASEAITC